MLDIEPMQSQRPTPVSLSDFKSKPPRVTVTRQPTDEGDIEATKALLNLYTKPDGFHCPKCGVVITSPEEALYHLADEINKSLDQLPR